MGFKQCQFGLPFPWFYNCPNGRHRGTNGIAQSFNSAGGISGDGILESDAGHFGIRFHNERGKSEGFDGKR